MRVEHALLAVVVAALSSATAPGQEYRVTHLGLPAGADENDHDSIKAFGINALGQVVGHDDELNKGFIWLPDVSDYGLAPNVLTHLTDIPEPESNAHLAVDINDYGIVVGQDIDCPLDPPECGMVWELTDFGPPFVVKPMPLNTVIANAVTNSPAPLYHVVGEAFEQGVTRGFVWDPSMVDPFAVTLLLPSFSAPGLDPNANAFDIVPAATSTTLEIVGAFGDLDLDVCEDLEVFGVAGHWALPDTEGQSLEPIAPPFQGTFAEAYAINDNKNIVGWMREFVSSENCFDRATFWDDKLDDDPINLGAIAGPFERTRANALTKDLPIQIVGRNILLNHAVRWVYDGSSVSYDDLNSLIDTTNTGYILYEATDVNEDGWIVAYGEDPLPPDFGAIRAFLLVPLGPCPWDVDQDGDVDMDDHTAVENHIKENRGVCPDGEICWADVDADGIVGSRDLQAVLMNQGCVP